VLDVTLRSDELLQKLLTHLDRQVGKGRYVLVVAADHGVCPLPEVAATGKGQYVHGETEARHAIGRAPAPAFAPRRVSPKYLKARAEAVLNDRYQERLKGLAGNGNGQPAEWVLGEPDDQWLYLNHQLVRRCGLEPVAVEEA